MISVRAYNEKTREMLTNFSAITWEGAYGATCQKVYYNFDSKEYTDVMFGTLKIDMYNNEIFGKDIIEYTDEDDKRLIGEIIQVPGGFIFSCHGKNLNLIDLNSKKILILGNTCQDVKKNVKQNIEKLKEKIIKEYILKENLVENEENEIDKNIKSDIILNDKKTEELIEGNKKMKMITIASNVEKKNENIKPTNSVSQHLTPVSYVEEEDSDSIKTKTVENNSELLTDKSKRHRRTKAEMFVERESVKSWQEIVEPVNDEKPKRHRRTNAEMKAQIESAVVEEENLNEEKPKRHRRTNAEMEEARQNGLF